MATDWTVTFNGLTMGPGTPYGITSLDGLRDLQGVTMVDTPKPQADGTWTSPDYNPSRMVTVGVDISGVNPTDFETNVAAFEAATQAQRVESPATFSLPGRDPDLIMAKIRGRVLSTDFAYAQGLSNAKLQFWASDPRRFGAQVAGSTHLPNITGGLGFPIHFPLAFTAITKQGQVSLVNQGNAIGPLVVRIGGPVTGPSVYLEDTDMTVAFSDALVLGAMDWLVIDMDARTALLRGQSSMAPFITQRDWFGLQPGSNTIAFQSTVYDSRALMTVSGSPAWT